jgi:glycine cleavage system transcriptional activator homolog
LPTNLPDPKSFYVVNHLDRLDDQKIQAFRQWIINSIKQEENE